MNVRIYYNVIYIYVCVCMMQAISDMVLVPAREARERLYRLYR